MLLSWGIFIIMPQNYFQQRKQALLSKQDKSSIGGWDKKIIPLCNKINKKQEYYTTSSCSGRIIIMIDNKKKAKGLFKFVSHNKVKLKELLKNIPKTKQNLKFKQEPMILHIACEELEHAKKLLNLAQKAGFKKIGIIALNKRIIIEINGSEKIEFPLMQKSKPLVNEDFLKVVLKKANKNLDNNWEKIKKFEKLI